MANFDEILRNLHDSATLTDTDGIITITPSRQFQAPADYNLTIGYAGDVNSQIITFKLPQNHEGHSLFNCIKKKIKWKNLTSGTEGFSTLVNPITADDGWTCQWEVPPEAMTQAGNLEVSIVLYDLATNGRIAFAWNTPSYKGFIIGVSLVDIGLIADTEEIMPAANEILSINSETRMIIVPSGYNTIVANYGDKGISKVYFSADKYIHGINILESEIIVNIKFNSEYTNKTILHNAVRPIAEESNKVIICWDIDKVITNNADYYTGNFIISISFIEYEGTGEEKIEKKKWTSSAYSGLSIGESLLLTDEHHIAERDEAAFKEIVHKHVDTYFEENEFTIEDETY